MVTKHAGIMYLWLALARVFHTSAWLLTFLETPRKTAPALQVPAGSVGIAGRQTGIYPFTSPGGWNIIGRTPLRMFNINDSEHCLLKTGDTVTFSAIDKQTFYYLNQYADH